MEGESSAWYRVFSTLAEQALRFCLTSTVLVAAFLGVVSFPSRAQVLAKPGWAGSGIAIEAWWPHAVFYRIDPARFQDSDGDGQGDLRGILERLDYLQSLGIDALVLDSKTAEIEPEALGDLVRAASQRQLRVLVTARLADTSSQARDHLLANVHSWMSAGAAGIWFPSPGPAQNDPGLINALRTQVQSFPGDRVLLHAPVPLSLLPPTRPGRQAHRIDPSSFRASRAGQLVEVDIPVAQGPDPSQTRSALRQVGEAESSGLKNLLRFRDASLLPLEDAVAEATLLFGSQGAVLLNFGQEIGLDAYPGNATALPLMQWTPANHTAAPAPASAGGEAASPEPQFGTYHPYVPPPRGLAMPASPVHVAPDLNVPEALPDPDSLPGFTTGPLPSPPQQGPLKDVTTQDRDPRSLLNQYRQLIALHHGNATLRNGTQAVLDVGSPPLLVWTRRAPAGSRTVANVVNAANFSDHPVTLSLDSELESHGLRPGALRPLFSSAPASMTGETTTHLTLPAHAVFLGEIYHGGAATETASQAPHAGRHSRHRVRR